MAAEILGIDETDLDVEELQVTSTVLYAGAHHLGKYCGENFTTYTRCHNEEKDQRNCLKKGKLVTLCATEFFKNIKQHCYPEFTEHWTCLDYNNQYFGRCRKTQAKYDTCVLEKLNIERDNKINRVKK